MIIFRMAHTLQAQDACNVIRLKLLLREIVINNNFSYQKFDSYHQIIIEILQCHRKKSRNNALSGSQTVQ